MAVVRKAGFHCNSFAAPVCTRLVVFWELFVYERKVLRHNFSKSFDLSDRRALFNLRGGGGGGEWGNLPAPWTLNVDNVVSTD